MAEVATLLGPFLDRIRIDAGASTRGINDSGVVIGFISDATERNDGFVGSDALGYQRLVAPGGEIPGNSTICSSINNLGQVVCYVWDSASQPVAAFIGTPSKGWAAELQSDNHPPGVEPRRRGARGEWASGANSRTLRKG